MSERHDMKKRLAGPTRLEIEELFSPLGDVTAAFHGGLLCSLAFTEHWPVAARALQRRFGAIERVPASAAARLRARLDAYFAGDLGALDGVETDPGGTPFQQAVWAALRRVSAGRTTTYGELARAIGAPAAVRAVGAANGANPIWLVIPCHRAIGSDGRLVGYAGGLERKHWLLVHERAREPHSQLALAGA
jgi:methylated-DNA-[protein]-cysteine S-methyltransferase